MTVLACTCGAPVDARLADHRSTCQVFQYIQARWTQRVARVALRNEERAIGYHAWSSGWHALEWMFNTHRSWSAPKGLGLEVETGRPSLGAENPARRKYAAVVTALVWALHVDAEDRADGAPVANWIRQHIGENRSCMWIAEECGRWTEMEIVRRVEHVVGLVSGRLRERGWLRDDGRDDGE